MFMYLIESFGVPPDRVRALRELILSYNKFMVSEGFLAQKSNMIVESEETGRISAGGVLSHGKFPPDGRELAESSNACVARLLEMREEIKALADDVDVQVFKASCSEDDHYCNHSTWRGLVLASDWPWSITPIICCDCGGRVARYRLPFGERIGGDVWDWNVASDSVESCWSASGVFEAWGNGERHDPLSRLSTLGLSIVKRIQSETGIDAWLYVPARTPSTVATCPRCEDEMSTVDTQCFWNQACPRCRIVTSVDATL